LGTFIDPSQESGCINSRTKPEIELIKLRGKQKLFYPAMPVDFAYLRATMADRYGNLSMEEEVSLQDTLAQAQAAHNSGGIVVAQVKRFCEDGRLDPLMVKVPGSLVDYVVLADEEVDHQQTYANTYNPNYTRSGSQKVPIFSDAPTDARTLVARRAAQELQNTVFEKPPIINLGIGIPAEIGRFVLKRGIGQPVLTVEGGAFGGHPAYGLSFGASEYPDAIIDQNNLFDLYDGGGIDMAFLGFAEADQYGNINVSRYSGNLKGVGGFVNISQSAKAVVFCGTLTSGGLEVEVDDDRGELNIVKEGKFTKFVNSVEQISFNGLYSHSKGKPVKIVTERAVFELEEGQLALSEVVAGIDIERDIEKVIGFPLKTSNKGIQVVSI
jgi:propionate CoA-transferase